MDWKKTRNALPENKTLGLVATMGCLHDGHASLIQRSKKENDYTVISIFVNPTQFTDSADYQNYPITFEKDLAMAKKLGVDFVIVPTAKMMYPDGNCIACITDDPLSKIMEGAFRPGHFNGVLTVVLKLLILARADHAYFGEKDYQQLLLVQKLTKNYLVDTEIIPCPTYYENSGLPMSSRNTRLNAVERKTAEAFFQYFQTTQKINLEDIRAHAEKFHIPIDYLEIHNDRLFLAIRVGPIRIIDNKSLEGRL